MRLGRELRRRRHLRKIYRILVSKGIHCIAEAVGIDGIGVLRPDRRPELLGEPGQA